MTLKLVAPPELDATEVTIGGERFLLIPFGALDGLYLRATPKLEQAPEADPEDPPAPKAPAPPVKVAGRPAKPQSIRKEDLPALELKLSEVQSTILAALAKKPMTSGEAIELMKGKATSGSVYQSLSDMRLKGLIETKEDENDGQRKNFVRRTAPICGSRD